jgi:hypothetical protein
MCLMSSSWSTSSFCWGRTPSPGKKPLLNVSFCILSHLWCSIIIDALDECDPQAFENGGFINCLLQWAPASCRILFSSQDDHYLNIADYIKEWLLVHLGDEGTTQSSLCHYTLWRLHQEKVKILNLT